MEIRGIVKGDALSYSIGCASILAKVTRDRLMCELAKEYPEYGFEKHKGYGTKQHIEALKEAYMQRYEPVKDCIRRFEIDKYILNEVC
jgi:ribonuclease HII